MIDAPFGVVEFLGVTFLITCAYLGVMVLYILVMLVVAVRESFFRRRQNGIEDYATVLASRFTIPLSIIAPAFNEQEMVVTAVRSLLAQAYPEFEVLVVDDGSTDDTVAQLMAAFELVPRQVSFKHMLETKPVTRVYSSRTEPRLTVICKENGGKADAINVGVNFARYRYLCCVDGDTIYAPSALLTGMTQVARDPARIVAGTSLLGVSIQPELALDDPKTRPVTNGHLLGDFQHLDMLRSFVAYRAAWSRLNMMLCVSGAFGLWRRDVILEMGGFSPKFTCEDIEMTFRIHERVLREGRPYRIVSLPSMVAQTEGPKSMRSLISQRARWHRVTMEATWHYARMIANPGYRRVGMLGLPYYVLFECLAPLFQVLSLTALVVAIVFGQLEWQVFLAFFGMMAFAIAIPTTIAISMHDRAYRDYSVSDLLRMLMLGPFDLLLYRPILMWAGLRGTLQFLKKDKSWDKFDRNVRVNGVQAPRSA